MVRAVIFRIFTAAVLAVTLVNNISSSASTNFYTAAALALEDSLVQKIDGKKLTALLKKKHQMFVKFTVHWSLKCQHLVPSYNHAAATVNQHHKLAELGIKIPFYEVDMGGGSMDEYTDSDASSSAVQLHDAHELSKKYEIKGYPTMIFFTWDIENNMGHSATYEYFGPHNSENIVDFIVHVATPALQPRPASDDEKLAVSLYNFGNNYGLTNGVKSAYTQLALENRRTAFFHYSEIGSSSSSSSQSESESSDSNINTVNDPRIEIIHRNEKKRVFYFNKDAEPDSSPNGDMTQIIDSMNHFYNQNKISQFGVIDRETFDHYSGKPLLWVLPSHGAGEEDFDRVKSSLSGLVEKVLDTIGTDERFNGMGDQKWMVAASNTHEFKAPIESLFNINTFPALVAQRVAGKSAYWAYPPPSEQNALSSVTKLLGLNLGNSLTLSSNSDESEYSDNEIGLVYDETGNVLAGSAMSAINVIDSGSSLIETVSGNYSNSTNNSTAVAKSSDSVKNSRALSDFHPDAPTQIANWLAKITDKTLSRTIKSEPLPDYEVEVGEPKILVGQNLEQEVFRYPERDSLIHVFAPWCGFSKKFSPEFRRLARKIHELKLENEVYIGSLDGTANESPVSAVNWDGFPTILFVRGTAAKKDGSDSSTSSDSSAETVAIGSSSDPTHKVYKYSDRDRSAEAVYKWMLEHSRYRDRLITEVSENGVVKIRGKDDL